MAEADAYQEFIARRRRDGIGTPRPSEAELMFPDMPDLERDKGRWWPYKTQWEKEAAVAKARDDRAYAAWKAERGLA